MKLSAATAALKIAVSSIASPIPQSEVKEDANTAEMIKQVNHLWHYPSTWFTPEAEEKFKEGTKYVAVGLAGGAMTAISTKIGEEFWKEIFHE